MQKLIWEAGQKGRELAELENYMQSLWGQYNLDKADEIAESQSNVDRDELIKRIEDENLFNKSFQSEISVSSKVQSKSQNPQVKPPSRQIYKPDLTQRPQPILALPSSTSTDVMSNIAKQIEQFHKLKAEVEDELDLCMEEINGSDLIRLPANFDEMVDMQAE